MHKVVSKTILSIVSTYSVLTGLCITSAVAVAEKQPTTLQISEPVSGTGLKITEALVSRQLGQNNQLLPVSDTPPNLLEAPEKAEDRSAISNWLPIQSGLRLTKALASKVSQISRLSLREAAAPQTESNSIETKINFTDVQPYVGLGYESEKNSRPGTYWLVEGGVVMKDTANRLRVSDSILNSGAQAVDIAGEQRLNNSLDSYEINPSVRMGVGYRW